MNRSWNLVLRRGAFVAALSLASSWPAAAWAHHEGSSDRSHRSRSKSSGFMSVQAHTHVFGTGAAWDRESTYIVSGGITPFRGVPWSIAIVQSFTVDTARSPIALRSGPFSSCEGCLAAENTLLSNSYRFDLSGLK